MGVEEDDDNHSNLPYKVDRVCNNPLRGREGAS